MWAEKATLEVKEQAASVCEIKTSRSHRDGANVQGHAGTTSPGTKEILSGPGCLLVPFRLAVFE